MLGFITRRLGVLTVILFGSTFLVYNLAAYSADPLAELRLSNDPRKETMILNVTRSLHLNIPPPIRYFMWLRGVLAGLIGKFDLGQTRDLSSVQSQIAHAIPTSFRLVVVATFTAVIIGVALGITTALRQYSKFDYAMTFVAFLLFSLPIFWVAVLLKEFLAIRFNNFLSSPSVPLGWLVFLSSLAAIFWSSVIGGARKQFWMVLGVTFLLSAAILELMNLTNWFLHPGFGPVLIGILSVGVAFAMTQLSTGLTDKSALKASLSMAGLAVIVYYPMQYIFDRYSSYLLILLLAIICVGAGIAASFIFSRIDRGPIARTASLTATLCGFLILVDRLMQTWAPYLSTDAINNRPIPTIGQRNDQLESPDFWINNLDITTHLFLPTVALTLISVAGWIRYSRGALLEVLNQDYIRTARSKGLSERTVIMRHAFRNTMLPLSSLFVGEVAGLIGGAIITERVFGWYGMGTLFNKALGTFDLNLLMGVLLLFSILGVLANLAADLLYAALDPRIRVSK